MIIYGVVFLLFAAAGNILMAQIDPEFRTVTNTLQTLFSYSLGAFDFSVSDQMYKDKWIPIVYQVVFIFNTLLLLNLLIALMNDTYAYFSQ